MCGSCQAYDTALLELAMSAGVRSSENADDVRADEPSDMMTLPTLGTQGQWPAEGLEAGTVNDPARADEDAADADAGTNNVEMTPERRQQDDAVDAALDAAVISADDAAAGSSAGDAGSAAPPIEAAPCPQAAGMTWNDNGHCYFPISVAYSWYVSRDTCRDFAAELVTITSAEEQAFVATLVSAEPHWTGFARFGAPAFNWITGEAAFYQNWEMGAPSPSGDRAVLLRPGTGQWFDEAVTATHAALCERGVN